jgi:hypothetical protein
MRVNSINAADNAFAHDHSCRDCSDPSDIIGSMVRTERRCLYVSTCRIHRRKFVRHSLCKYIYVHSQTHRCMICMHVAPKSCSVSALYVSVYFPSYSRGFSRHQAACRLSLLQSRVHSAYNPQPCAITGGDRRSTSVGNAAGMQLQRTTHATAQARPPAGARPRSSTRP